jgi:hypothetical protein
MIVSLAWVTEFVLDTTSYATYTWSMTKASECGLAWADFSLPRSQQEN